MAPPRNIPKFPTYDERLSLMEELRQATETGDVLTSGQYLKQYVDKLKQLNELMDQYSEIDEEFGLPVTLDDDGKRELLEAMEETAKAGELFLADAENKQANMKVGIQGIVGRMQNMLSRDFDMLNLYDPKKNPLSFPEIQSSARTQVVDFRGKQMGIMTNKLSGRIPMTVVDANGNRHPGVFTKASYVSIKRDYEDMIRQAVSYYDDPAVRRQLGPYKTALINDGAFPGMDREQITEEMVVDKLKEPIRNILPKYRDYLIQSNQKLYGQDPATASDEQVLGFLYNEVMGEKEGPVAAMKKFGVDLMRQPEEVMDELTEGLKRGVTEGLSDVVNGRDLGLRDGDRVDQRNSAMSAMAGVLGLNSLCARSVNMKYLDEEGIEHEGTFMEFAEGLDLMGKGGSKLFAHVSDAPFDGRANPSLANLQVLDFLSGNVDRHGGNMTYKVDENGKITGVQAFDNDTSFGVVPIDKNNGIFRLAGVNQLKVITESMSKKIANLSPEMLKFSLRGRGLTDQEIQASCQRLSELKRAIKNGVKAKTMDDINASGKKLCIVKDEDLKKISFDDLARQKHTLFENVKAYMDAKMKKAREKYPFNRDAEKPAPRKFEEVNTTDRSYTAGGISESMSDMARMIKNDVTGFVVSGMSKFLHSSGPWRSMISAVKNAEAVSRQVKREIKMEYEGLSRDDPRVKAQLDKADRAMKQVEDATNAYLQRKMREKHVKDPEDLVGKGKHAYEQKRIDYALKLRKSIMKYKAIQNPESKAEKDAKAHVQEKIKLSNARKAKAAQQGAAMKR